MQLNPSPAGGGGPLKAKSMQEGAASPVMLTQQQALWLELMQFYIREAWLLDERKYEEWPTSSPTTCSISCRAARTCRAGNCTAS